MADIWYDVDTALSEVPVNILPLLDATDFKTIEDAVAYNAAGLALHWHFCTTAGAYTVTAVTPTTGGSYDWTDQGTAGIYTIEIPASGGASINNDTEGFGWFTGVATGVLPWRGPVCGFRAAALNNSMIDGTTIDVNVTAVSGDTAAADNLENAFDDTAGPVPWLGIVDQGTAQSATGTTLVLRAAAAFADNTLIGMTVGAYGSTQGYWQFRTITDNTLADDTITVDTWDVTPSGTITYKIFGTAPASTSAPMAVNVTQWAGSAVATPSVAGVPEVDLTHVAGATTNVAALATNVDAILTDTAVIGAAGAGLTALATQASVNTIDDFLDTEVAAILAAVDTEVAAIKAKTDSLTFTVAGQVDANIQSVNDVTVAGDGSGTPWGP